VPWYWFLMGDAEFPIIHPWKDPTDSAVRSIGQPGPLLVLAAEFLDIVN